jgi:farnesyl-diphosphate farnesyltransferase
MSTSTASVEECSGKDRRDENFPVGSLLIRPDLRRHVHAFYAFARHADDIADSPVLLPAEKIARLDVMEAVLLGEREGGSPSAAGLRSSLAETGVGAEHSRHLLRAFRQDATKSRYATWDELLDYCRYSAMPVGRHVLDLHGEDAGSQQPSDALCASLQVLNHLQDCQADLRTLDRCYLPRVLLEQHGAAVGDLAGGRASAGLRGCFDALLDEVDRLNGMAEALPPLVASRRLRLETAVILGLARRLARRLRRGDPVAGRVKLTRLDFAGSLLEAGRFLR